MPKFTVTLWYNLSVIFLTILLFPWVCTLPDPEVLLAIILVTHSVVQWCTLQCDQANHEAIHKDK